MVRKTIDPQSVWDETPCRADVPLPDGITVIRRSFTAKVVDTCYLCGDPIEGLRRRVTTVTGTHVGWVHAPDVPELNDHDWLAAAYVEGGRSTESIASELGITRQTVSEAIRAVGLTVRPRRPRGSPKVRRSSEDVAASRAAAKARADATLRDKPEWRQARAVQTEAAIVALSLLPPERQGEGGPVATKRRVLTARIAHPDATITELAKITGMSRGSYSPILLRALAAAEKATG